MMMTTIKMKELNNALGYKWGYKYLKRKGYSFFLAGLDDHTPARMNASKVSEKRWLAHMSLFCFSKKKVLKQCQLMRWWLRNGFFTIILAFQTDKSKNREITHIFARAFLLGRVLAHYCRAHALESHYGCLWSLASGRRLFSLSLSLSCLLSSRFRAGSHCGSDHAVWRSGERTAAERAAERRSQSIYRQFTKLRWVLLLLLLPPSFLPSFLHQKGW